MEKEYICKKCDFIADNLSVLGNHYKYSHKEEIEGNLDCLKCGKILKNKSGLTNHSKRCKGPKKTNEKICQKCEKLKKISRWKEKRLKFAFSGSSQ